MPGVPPDAVDNVKRLLKGIFRRGKNKKQGRPGEKAPLTQSTGTSAHTNPTTHNGSAPVLDLQLPTTTAYPSGASQHTQPYKTVSPDHAAQSTPAPVTPDLRKGASVQGVSPTSQPPQSSTGPVSATEDKDVPPAPPPKNESAASAPSTTERAGIHNRENVTPETIVPRTATTGGANPPKPLPPLTESGATKKSNATEEPVEEKVAVHLEHPPVRPVMLAPGMSATSGPLEDFPEGMASEEKD